MAESLLNLDRNPVRKARVKLSLSLHEAARKAKVNYQTWYLTECGCYAKPPPAVLGFLENEGFNVLYLEREYQDHVAATRDEFYAEFLHLYPRISITGERNPVVELRESLGLSRSSFAKQLCVQPAVLYKVEQDGRVRGLPQQLREALIEVALPEPVMNKLEEVLKSGY